MRAPHLAPPVTTATRAIPSLGGCRAWGRACVEAGNGLSLGAKHSHAWRHGAHSQRRISPFLASTRRAGAIFGAIRRCRLVVGANPTPRRRLGWHRNSPRRGPEPKPDSLLGRHGCAAPGGGPAGAVLRNTTLRHHGRAQLGKNTETAVRGKPLKSRPPAPIGHRCPGGQWRQMPTPGRAPTWLRGPAACSVCPEARPAF